jgi:hypothetical protein
MQEPKRYQCRHIFTDGHRCGSPCLRGEDLCYYHHTTRKPAQNPRTRRSRRNTFTLPLPEDRSAIQHSIGEVLQRIAANDIDPRRAGLLLYGLQIASLNLPKPNPKTTQTTETVDEVTTHPQLGPLAPEAEFNVNPNRPKSLIATLIEELNKPKPAAQVPAPAQQPEPVILPEIQATATRPLPPRRHLRIKQRNLQLPIPRRTALEGVTAVHGSPTASLLNSSVKVRSFASIRGPLLASNLSLKIVIGSTSDTSQKRGLAFRDKSLVSR